MFLGGVITSKLLPKLYPTLSKHNQESRSYSDFSPYGRLHWPISLKLTVPRLRFCPLRRLWLVITLLLKKDTSTQYIYSGFYMEKYMAKVEIVLEKLSSMERTLSWYLSFYIIILEHIYLQHSENVWYCLELNPPVWNVLWLFNSMLPAT